MDKNFNLGDFKKWMRGQKDPENIQMIKNTNLIGLKVESKINTKKLVQKIIAEEGDQDDLAIDFRRNGGIIAETTGNSFLVKVDSGSFYIPRKYVRKY